MEHFSTTHIDKNNIPKHIAIIMDGNGRWAQERGEDRIMGHHEGVKSVREIVKACGEIGVGYLTLYAFSTENWSRPKVEVDALMEIFVSTLRKEVDLLKKNNVKLHVIGDVQSLPINAQKELQEGLAETADSTGLNLILALSYSSKWEIQNAVTNIAKEVLKGTIKVEDINDELIHNHLATKDYPDPELLIRTSGEYRISNFLLYQIAYSELYFTEVNWPSFRKEDLYLAIENYQNRERRFGLTGAQVKK